MLRLIAKVGPQDVKSYRRAFNRRGQDEKLGGVLERKEYVNVDPVSRIS